MSLLICPNYSTSCIVYHEDILTIIRILSLGTDYEKRVPVEREISWRMNGFAFSLVHSDWSLDLAWLVLEVVCQWRVIVVIHFIDIIYLSKYFRLHHLIGTK